eukprot:364787-Chlamydomonas_euryale.AAC.20
MGGAFGDPPEGGLLLFKPDVAVAEIEAFVAADPYVKNGLVTAWCGPASHACVSRHMRAHKHAAHNTCATPHTSHKYTRHTSHKYTRHTTCVTQHVRQTTCVASHASHHTRRTKHVRPHC